MSLLAHGAVRAPLLSVINKKNGCFHVCVYFTTFTVHAVHLPFFFPLSSITLYNTCVFFYKKKHINSSASFTFVLAKRYFPNGPVGTSTISFSPCFHSQYHSPQLCCIGAKSKKILKISAHPQTRTLFITKKNHFQ